MAPHVQEILLGINGGTYVELEEAVLKPFLGMMKRLGRLVFFADRLDEDEDLDAATEIQRMQVISTFFYKIAYRTPAAAGSESE